MKNQIGFFISLIFATILLIFTVFLVIYYEATQPQSLQGISSIELTGLEYKSANGFLDSLIYYEGIKVPAIDLYAGYYNNPYIQNIIINQTINDTIYYLNTSSTVLYFDFSNNQIGICVNKYPVSYSIYLNGKETSFYVCAPTLLLIYLYNITCQQWDLHLLH